MIEIIQARPIADQAADRDEFATFIVVSCGGSRRHANAHGKLAPGSAETEAQIEDHWRLGCKVLNLPGNDVSTYSQRDESSAGRAHARLKSIGVPTP